MRSSRLFRIAGAACVRAVAIAMMLVVATRTTVARADNVDELVNQLGSADSDKVRLSAALNLTKLGNPRAILPLAVAVERDGDKSVRGAAAVGLGKLVNDKTDPKVRAKVVAALTRAKDSDDSEFVKAQAARALKAIGASETVVSSGGAAIYVNIGPMSAKTGDAAIDPKLQALMVKIATRTMARVASNMTTSWPGGVPSKAMLDAKSTLGFYIDGTLNDLKVKESRSSTTVSCKINMLLASYPDKSIFGLLSGGASVQASGSASDVALAREDCVSAVVEDLIAKKIVPTITTKAGSP